MSYANVADLVLRYSQREIQLRTDRLNTGAVVAEVAQQALDKATAIIDAHLRNRYAVPLATVPLEIKDICETLARWKLADDNPPDHIVDEAEKALKMLGQYATGTLTLDLPLISGPVPGASIDGLASFESNPRQFGRGRSWFGGRR